MKIKHYPRITELNQGWDSDSGMVSVKLWPECMDGRQEQYVARSCAEAVRLKQWETGS